VEALGRAPQVGDCVELLGVRLRVEAVEDLSVSQVCVTVLGAAAGEAG
jgi:CBS domain containing-hemolysin-like protein